MTKDTKELKEQLEKLIQDALSKDKSLREEFGVGEKFRFVKDKLAALESSVEDALASVKIIEDEAKQDLEEDEAEVYVYIFNAHGIDVQTWTKMLHPSVYFEYSVNRPIYESKDHIESVIRNKPNKTQHGYMTVGIKKEDIIINSEQGQKDSAGVPMIKVREGSLKPEKFINFTHNDIEYFMGDDGKLIKFEKSG